MANWQAMAQSEMCQRFQGIKPTYADSPALAEVLFLTLKSRIATSEKIFLDTPEVNPTAVALAEKYMMQPSFETAVDVYRGLPCSTSGSCVWCYIF